ncbi:MAG TPA: SAF domain-containing protein [Anaerolineae bacterium]|jgi:Flp pilus assembly protein CpaB
MRKLFIILGAVIAIVAAGGVYLFMQLNRPAITEVPVAISEIPAGTVLTTDLFKLTRVSNVEADAISQWVTYNEWNMAQGKVATTDIHAGFPIAKVQVDPESTAEGEKRLSVVLTGTNEYYAVIPVSANEIGNYVQTGDRVDLFITLGAMDKAVIELSPQDINAKAPGTGATVAFTRTEIPVSKLVMQNMYILRIDRDPARQAASSNNQTAGQQTAYIPGDVKRLYVRVDRDQAEVLNFILNTAKRSFMVRAFKAEHNNVPTDGVTWDDFVRWFIAQRGNGNVQPFNAVSPAQPASGGK